MIMSFRFENLEIWQETRNLVKDVYTITRNFPAEERFGLTNQIRRASVSIALNIAEGSDKKSDIDFRRFLRMSIGSCEELVTGLYIALDQKCIQKDKFDIIYDNCNLLVIRINALIKSLKQ